MTIRHICIHQLVWSLTYLCVKYMTDILGPQVKVCPKYLFNFRFGYLHRNIDIIYSMQTIRFRRNLSNFKYSNEIYLIITVDAHSKY